jgi:hypothetical protein
MELLKLNRNELRRVTGLHMGHCHLKAHLFKMGLMNSPICEKCLEKYVSVTHILCACEATVYLKFRHLGHYFMESGGYQDAPIRYYTSFKVWVCCKVETERDAQYII